MYAMTCKRPDIAFVVAKLSRFTSNPRPHHWMAIRRILKYLKELSIIVSLIMENLQSWKVIQTQVGSLMKKTTLLQVVGCSFMGEVPYHGLPRNKLVLLIPLWLLSL